jgi:energy-coupling factor transporter ATP-binding protein EcfA2
MSIDPLKEEFLAVVTSWSTYGQKGGLVGSAIPVYCTSRNEVLTDPVELFPDPGYVFLVYRGQAVEWDFVLVRPERNEKYYPGKSKYLSFAMPTVLEAVPPDCKYASVLDVPAFDPTAINGVIRAPAQNVTPVFYARAQRKLFGPLKRVKVNRRSDGEAIDSIQWAPYGDDSSVYEFAEEDLARHRLERHAYRHANPDDEAVARNPIYLLTGPVLTAKSDKAHDRLSPAELAEWFLKSQALPAVPENLIKTFRSAPDLVKDATTETVRQRLRRVSALFGTLDVFQTERAAAVARFVESEAGQRLLKQQLDREVERRAAKIDAEVAQLKKDQSKEKYKLKQELDAFRADHQKKVEQYTHDMADLERKRAAAEAAVGVLQKQMLDGVGALAARLQDEAPVFAALSTGLRQASVAAGGSDRITSSLPQAPAASWGKVTLPAPTKELEPVSDESAFVDQLAWELAARDSLFFTRDFLANLYVTLKASGLNLVMGPPGYGKSSVVAALARAMGHGHALLEVAVRRTWSDDRYLLGFFDTFHNRYDPGPTGLATRLLQAQTDWEQGRRGLYFILMDEFNLAAPEYYFSQLLQVLTRPADQPRAVRLYDPAAHAHLNGEKPVDQLRLYPNVSFWGTINYDETTERLSPRLLDRTGMVFLNTRDVVPSGEASDRPGLTRGVAAGQFIDRCVRGPEHCPEGHWELIDPLLGLLKRQSEEWGAGIDLSPRVLEAIRRYLANSVGLLPSERAVDFVFEQRVLPVLRGRGPKFTARVRALSEKLVEKGLERSARHVQDALALAEVNFGDVDFLAY